MFDIIQDKLFVCDRNKINCLIEILDNSNVNEPEDNTGTIIFNDKRFSKYAFLEEMPYLMKFLRKQWIFVQNSVILDNNPSLKDISYARQNINAGFKNILALMCSTSEYIKQKNNMIVENFNTIQVSVLSIETHDENIITKICYSNKNVKCPIQEYFHCYLEIKIYILLIKLKCDTLENDLEQYLKKMICDLVILERKYFPKAFHEKQTSFLCPCIENVWILILVILKNKTKQTTLWNYMRQVLEKDDAVFSLWILKDLANLQYSLKNSDIEKFVLEPNYEFIVEKLKMALHNSPSDILQLIRLTYHFLSVSWRNESCIEVILVLWDHFSKRLNTSLNYKTDSTINSMEFSEHIDLIILSIEESDEDFDAFISLLLEYMRQQPNHWGKIKCRIFSQLSPFKIAEMNEIGIYNVSKLFLCLMQVNHDELSKKLVSIYENLKDKMVTTSIMNIYVSFILRYVRENKNIEKIVSPLVKLLQTESEKQSDTQMLKNFLNSYDNIVKLSGNMLLHQWLLIDSWIIKYLAKCYLPDLVTAAQIFLSTIERVKAEDAWSYWEDNFKKNIYFALKQIGTGSSCPPIIGKLTGEMSILSLDLLNDSFNIFTAPNINFQVTEKYLYTILKEYQIKASLTPLQEKVAIQSWIRICLYSTQEFHNITNVIMSLETIPECVRNGMTRSPDPFVKFIEIMSLNKTAFIQSSVLCRFSEMCFENLDQSLEVSISNLKNEAVILRIYTCVALTILQCGSLLYDRHKTSSPVTKLVSCLLFPTEFLLGKVSHLALESIRKTWHIFFEGLFKLGPDDPYIQRTLRDLILKYLPHFSVAESPIYQCLSRENRANVVLEKISSIYFKHPTKENESNVTKALKILNEFVHSNTSVNLLKIVVNQTLFGLCEVYIFHSQKNLALSIIMFILTCSFYNQVKEEIITNLLLVTEKHLAFNSKSYFSLMNILARTIPSEMIILRQNIVEKIKNIERIRGIGYDDNLRNYLNALDAALKC